MKRELSIGLAVIPLMTLISAAACSIFLWDAGMHMPLLIGTAAAAIVAWIGGWNWSDIQSMMVQGVSRAMPAIFILLIIGIIISTWIAGGIIPTMIYYGFSFIHPSFFVPAVAIVTGIVSIALGSSFTSIATVGLAFMVIGEGMGFPPALVAGAVISGAFFGDKLSPLSDTTNIAPAMAETDLFSHVKHMLWDTLPAFFIAVLLYAFFGQSASGGLANSNTLRDISVTLKDAFIIHPILLLMPLLAIVVMIKRIPALPALLGIGFLGGIIAVFVQGNSVSAVMNIMTSGYVGDTGLEAVDSLLNRGGMLSMLPTIGLLIIATALGGVLEETGAFRVMLEKVLGRVKTTGSLIAATIASTFGVALASGEQYLTIILPARTFVQKYKDMGIDTKNLSRCVEAAGTVGINLVPWGVTAVFSAEVLGLSPGEFIPYTFFAFLVPIINIIYGYTGWTITKTDSGER